MALLSFWLGTSTNKVPNHNCFNWTE